VPENFLAQLVQTLEFMPGCAKELSTWRYPASPGVGGTSSRGDLEQFAAGSPMPQRLARVLPNGLYRKQQVTSEI
ncbi:hypothetical protein ACTO5A_35255, partial [Pseudomonas aeruginosa]